MGVVQEGARNLARVVSFHISADLSQVATDPDVLIRWLWLPDLGIPGVLVPMGPGHWGPESEEWVFHLDYGPDDGRALDDESVLADLRTGLGLSEEDLTVHMISRWTLEGVVADRYRVRRVLVAGDAAHRHPPTGGLGLTSAMHDVQNLTWKLAAVLNGHADDALLDTYEAERRPVDATNVQRSLENAMNHIAINALFGGGPEADEEDNWRQARRLWSDDPADADFRRTFLAAVAAQSMEFNELREAGRPRQPSRGPDPFWTWACRWLRAAYGQRAIEIAKGVNPVDRMTCGTKRIAASVARAVWISPRSLIHSLCQPRSVSSSRTVCLACGSSPERNAVGVWVSVAGAVITGKSMVLRVLTTRVSGSACWSCSARLEPG